MSVKPTDFLPPDPGRVRERYFELLDAHGEDFTGDELGQVAWEDELTACLSRYVDAVLAEWKVRA